MILTSQELTHFKTGHIEEIREGLRLIETAIETAELPDYTPQSVMVRIESELGSVKITLGTIAQVLAGRAAHAPN